MHKKQKLKPAPKSVKRLKGKLRQKLRRGRGRSLIYVIQDLRPVIRGWVVYYRLSEVHGIFEVLDKWLRRKLRCIQWRQWKRPWTRRKMLIALGLAEDRANHSALNGRGPWWNAGASHMHHAMPTRQLLDMGLTSFLGEYRRLACLS